MLPFVQFKSFEDLDFFPKILVACLSLVLVQPGVSSQTRNLCGIQFGSIYIWHVRTTELGTPGFSSQNRNYDSTTTYYKLHQYFNIYKLIHHWMD